MLMRCRRRPESNPTKQSGRILARSGYAAFVTERGLTCEAAHPVEIFMHGSTTSAVALAATALLFAPAHADWPTDAKSPLFVGSAQGPDQERHSIAVTGDEAVWIAWQDPYCVGDLRLQRVSLDAQVLAPGGIAAQPDPTCGFVLPPYLAASFNDVVLARAYAGLTIDPVQRFDAEGALVWQLPLVTGDQQTLGDIHPMPNGDVLIISKAFSEFHIDRIAPSGDSVWNEPLVFGNVSPSAEVRATIDDGAGGVYLFWDWHTTYRKTVRVTRITPDGQLAFQPMPPIALGELEGISRHTPPAFIADGSGGVYFVWTKGFESGTTPAPLLLQRIGPDGSLAFPLQGHRIALGSERQFDPALQLDPATGHLFIAWRDGLFDQQALRAQRVSSEGDLLWGDNGVPIAPLDQLLGRYAPLWWDQTLNIPTTGPDGLFVHRLAADGSLLPDVWDIAPALATRAVRAANVHDGLVIIWQTAEGFDTSLFAQRVNRNGRLGNPACNAADFATPFGALDFFDVAEFLESFSNLDPAADIVHDGVFNFFDIAAFLEAFSLGCP